MAIIIDGNKVRKLREGKYYSQRELSRMANVSNETIARVESEGEAPVLGATMRKLAKALEVNPDDLVKHKSYGGAVFEQYLAQAREKSRDELLERYAQLDALVDELSTSPATAPKRLGGQASPRHFRQLTQSVNELRAVGEVLNERAKKRETALAKVR